MKNILLLFLSIFLISAQAEETEYWLNGGKELSFKAGHSSSDCNGKGELTMAFDQIMEMHLPCQSFGTSCDYNIRAELVTSGESLEEAVKSSSKFVVNLYFGNSFREDEFTMPQRSIYCKADGVYINFPGRILTKINNGIAYYPCKDVAFSDKPMYKNK